jgi:hypothetical protein
MFEVLNSKLLVQYLIGPVAGFGASAEAEKSWGVRVASGCGVEWSPPPAVSRIQCFVRRPKSLLARL